MELLVNAETLLPFAQRRDGSSSCESYLTCPDGCKSVFLAMEDVLEVNLATLQRLIAR